MKKKMLTKTIGLSLLPRFIKPLKNLLHVVVLERVGVTQAPWLHKFHLGRISVHPNYWTSHSQKGWIKKKIAHPPTINFFFTSYYHNSPNYPNYPPTPLILQWQNLYLFSTKIFKLYIILILESRLDFNLCLYLIICQICL